MVTGGPHARAPTSVRAFRQGLCEVRFEEGLKEVSGEGDTSGRGVGRPEWLE